MVNAVSGIDDSELWKERLRKQVMMISPCTGHLLRVGRLLSVVFVLIHLFLTVT